MASLTIRNLEEETKQVLRIRAAEHGSSLEEEVRWILRRAAREGDGSDAYRPDNLYDAIRALVEPHGGFDLEIPDRGFAVATRNVQDFEHCGVDVINPWEAGA